MARMLAPHSESFNRDNEAGQQDFKLKRNENRGGKSFVFFNNLTFNKLVEICTLRVQIGSPYRRSVVKAPHVIEQPKRATLMQQ